MDVDQDAEFGPELLADRGDDRISLFEFGVLQKALRGAEGIELGRLEAEPDDFLGRLDEGLGVRSARYQPLA